MAGVESPAEQCGAFTALQRYKGSGEVLAYTFENASVHLESLLAAKAGTGEIPGVYAIIREEQV